MGVMNMIAVMITTAKEIQEFMAWLYSTAGGFYG